MADEKYGIDETIDVIDAAESIVDAYEISKADGSVDIKDFPNFIVPLTKLPAAITGADNVPNELTDVSDEEYEFLVAKYGDRVNDPDWQDLIKGMLIVARASKALVQKRKNKAEA